MARYVPPRERRIRAMLAEARDLLRRQRPLNARLRCQQVLALEPDRVDALTLLGVLAGRGGDAEEALTHLNRAAAQRPRDPNLLTNLGSALAGLERYDDAMAAWERALLLNPEHAEAHANRRLLRALLRAQGVALPERPGADEPLVPLRPQFVIDDDAAADAEAAAEAAAALARSSTEDRPPEPDNRHALIDDALRQIGIDLAAADRSLDNEPEDPLQRLADLSAVAVLVTARAMGRVQAEPLVWCQRVHAALAPGGIWALAVDDAGSAAPWLPLGAVYDLEALQQAAAAAGLTEVLSGSGPMRELHGREVNGHLLVLRRPA